MFLHGVDGTRINVDWQGCPTITKQTLQIWHPCSTFLQGVDGTHIHGLQQSFPTACASASTSLAKQAVQPNVSPIRGTIKTTLYVAATAQPPTCQLPHPTTYQHASLGVDPAFRTTAPEYICTCSRLDTHDGDDLLPILPLAMGICLIKQSTFHLCPTSMLRILWGTSQDQEPFASSPH